MLYTNLNLLKNVYMINCFKRADFVKYLQFICSVSELLFYLESCMIKKFSMYVKNTNLNRIFLFI